MRRRGQPDSAGPGEEPAVLLDSDEQAAVVRELEEEAAAQARRWRRAFAALCVFMAGAIGFCLFTETYAPFMAREAVALDEAHGAVAVSYCVLLVSNLSSAALCLDLGPRAWTRGVALLTAAVPLLWWLQWLAAHALLEPAAVWLPGGSMVLAATATYLDREMEDMLRSTEGLRSLQYDYKKV